MGRLTIEQAIEYWKIFLDEIEELKATPGIDPEEWDKQEKATVAALEALVKQRHYEDLEEQGRLIVTPETGIGDLSDGYHTFNELYHHRAVLFSVICNAFKSCAWKSKKHSDGTMYDGMFIVGIDTPEGSATYHYDIEPYWNMFDVKELDNAPEWDGHTPDDAISRIAGLSKSNRLVELPCAVGDTENYKMYTKFRAEIDAMYSPLVINECDEVVEIMHNTQQIGLLCVKDKYIQGLYILPEYRKKGHGRKAILSYIEKYGMPKDLTILNTNNVANNFWNSIFELKVLRANPVDTYYEIKALKEEAEAKLKELEGVKDV